MEERRPPVGAVTTLSQTYPQLANQIGEQQWTPDEMALVRRAFELAATLFASAERGSGKPFIDHLIGTASGTIIGGGRSEETAAALLHAAYEQGDFGDGRTGPRPKRREIVRSAVGERVEMLVYRYHLLGWSREVALDAVVKLEHLDDLERSVLLIRSANELDDALDSGLLLSGKHRLPMYSREVHEATVRLAEALGTPTFEEIVRRTLLEAGAGPVPPELILDRIGSHRRLPLSATDRIRPRVLRSAAKAQRTWTGVIRGLRRRVDRHVSRPSRGS